MSPSCAPEVEGHGYARLIAQSFLQGNGCPRGPGASPPMTPVVPGCEEGGLGGAGRDHSDFDFRVGRSFAPTVPPREG